MNKGLSNVAKYLASKDLYKEAAQVKKIAQMIESEDEAPDQDILNKVVGEDLINPYDNPIQSLEDSGLSSEEIVALLKTIKPNIFRLLPEEDFKVFVNRAEKMIVLKSSGKGSYLDILT